MVQTKEWTVDMLDELPDDGNRYEVIDGALFVTPAPADVHQLAVSELAFILRPYAKVAGLDLFAAPTAVRFPNRGEVQPDVLALLKMPRPLSLTQRNIKELILAVEVLSPSTKRVDRGVKRKLYQSERVADYWIVDLENRAIELWHPDSTEAEILTTSLSWRPSPQHPALTVDLVTFFQEIFGE